MSNGLDVLKKFAVNLGVNAAIEVVRGWFNEQIKNVTPSDLYEAVVYDRNLWATTPSSIKASGFKYKKSFGGLFQKYEKHVTTELILRWLSEDHPDLFSTLINIPDNKGIIWFDKQIHMVKQQILGM